MPFSILLHLGSTSVGCLQNWASGPSVGWKNLRVRKAGFQFQLWHSLMALWLLPFHLSCSCRLRFQMKFGAFDSTQNYLKLWDHTQSRKEIDVLMCCGGVGGGAGRLCQNDNESINWNPETGFPISPQVCGFNSLPTRVRVWTRSSLTFPLFGGFPGRHAFVAIEALYAWNILWTNFHILKLDSHMVVHGILASKVWNPSAIGKSFST